MPMPPTVEQMAKVLVTETFRHRGIVVGLFVFINVAAVAIGLAWPKTYTSSTTILVEEKNIIQPLMHGAAVATDVRDRAKIAKEVIFGRTNLGHLLDTADWIQSPLSELERERLAESIKARTRIFNVGHNLIRIEFTDSNAERAFKTTRAYADLFVTSSLGNQTQESQQAFEFIDKQVKEYHQKLTAAEQALKEFRSQNIDARPGTAPEVAGRISALQATIERTTLELKEAQIKQASLEKQLSGEAEVTASLTREGQYVGRIVELQAQLDTLRLSYHDTYPDVVRLKNQIEDLRELVVTEQRRREQGRRDPGDGRRTDARVVDDTVRVNPVYQQLRRELYETKINIETLTTRLSETKNLLHAELDRARRVHGGEAVLTELTRDYEVNRDIYQDLLRRRENARVSKNLDREQQGLTLKVQEAAFLPLQPSGIRFLHFMLGGMVLGLLVPPGLIFALKQIDPRIRTQSLIPDKLNLPLLAAVPEFRTPAEEHRVRRNLAWHARIVLVTLGFAATMGVLRSIGVV